MKRALQIGIAIAGLVFVCTGLGGMILGSSITGEATGSADLDSQFRFLSGLQFGIGLLFWSTIRDIEHKGSILRVLTALSVLGGAARLPSILLYGLPEDTMTASLVVELAVIPMLYLGQKRLAAGYKSALA